MRNVTTIEVQRITNGFIVYHDHLVDVGQAKRDEIATEMDIKAEDVPPRVVETVETFCSDGASVAELVGSLASSIEGIHEVRESTAMFRRRRRRRRRVVLND